MSFLLPCGSWARLQTNLHLSGTTKNGFFFNLWRFRTDLCRYRMDCCRYRTELCRNRTELCRYGMDFWRFKTDLSRFRTELSRFRAPRNRAPRNLQCSRSLRDRSKNKAEECGMAENLKSASQNPRKTA